MKTWLTDNFDIEHPIIMAPMFLVSNDAMLRAAKTAGILGCAPALNWKSPQEFEEALKNLKASCSGSLGINLIVNKSNIHLKDQLSLLEKYPVDFVITSLGSPEEAIQRLKPLGTKVFCDVVNTEQAQKVESLGADALIAVNSGAGGHAGKIPATVLIPMLKKVSKLPIIAAGGVNSGDAFLSMMALGAEGLSMGSPFIASTECSVNKDYKEAIVKYGAQDIVLTDKISGTPCTVIETPYVKKIGTNQNFIERFLNTHRKLKKYAKMLTYYRGMKLLEKAAFGATYRSVWCAGPSIEFTTKEESVQEIVQRIVSEVAHAKAELDKKYETSH